MFLSDSAWAPAIPLVFWGAELAPKELNCFSFKFLSSLVLLPKKFNCSEIGQYIISHNSATPFNSRCDLKGVVGRVLRQRKCCMVRKLFDQHMWNTVVVYHGEHYLSQIPASSVLPLVSFLMFSWKWNSNTPIHFPTHLIQLYKLWNCFLVHLFFYENHFSFANHFSIKHARRAAWLLAKKLPASMGGKSSKSPCFPSSHSWVGEKTANFSTPAKSESVLKPWLRINSHNSMCSTGSHIPDRP